MAASWPTSVSTDSTLYIAVNELQTNLSSGINNSVTTITINSTTSFPTVGLILIDNEVIKYTGISGSDLTGCTRAFDGTTAASHSAAAVVSFAVMAAHHNVLKDEVKAVEQTLADVVGLSATLPLTVSRALVSDSSGHLAVSATTAAQLAFVAGVTSAIQTQIDAKAATDLSNVASVSANVPMNSHKFTGMAAGTAAGESVRVEQLHYTQTPVQGTSATNIATTSSTFQDTSLTASITPTSASHKIKVSVTGTAFSNAANHSCFVTIKRGSTNIGGTNGFVQVRGGGGNSYSAVGITVIDSPAATTSTTYTVQIKNDDNATDAEWNPTGNLLSVIVLEEVI